MKKLRELLRTNRWFAVVLLLEAAVLASLVASLFGAPYKLQLTPADFSNDYPQIAAVNEDGTTLQIWNNSEDFTPPEDKAISFSTAGSAMRSGAYEVTIQYFSCETHRPLMHCTVRARCLFPARAIHRLSELIP